MGGLMALWARAGKPWHEELDAHNVATSWRVAKMFIPTPVISTAGSGDLPNGALATAGVGLDKTADGAELGADGTTLQFKLMARAIASNNTELSDLVAKVSMREITAYGFSAVALPLYTLSATPIGEVTFTNPKRSTLQKATSAAFALDPAKQYMMTINMSIAANAGAQLNVAGHLVCW